MTFGLGLNEALLNGAHVAERNVLPHRRLLHQAGLHPDTDEARLDLLVLRGERFDYVIAGIAYHGVGFDARATDMALVNADDTIPTGWRGKGHHQIGEDASLGEPGRV